MIRAGLFAALTVLLMSCQQLGFGQAEAPAADPPAAEAEAEAPPAATEAPPAATEAPPAPAPTPDPPRAPEAPPQSSAAQDACEKKSGNFIRVGQTGARVCQTRTRDANKVCTASSQCDGVCLARSGTCSPVTPLLGCNDIVTDSGGMATVCLD
ncbi:MAG: hypothetical protein QNJ16_03925 [Rhodobacter sp.]|nr:hypothetical protein [Rhodobacter sp.]